MNENKPRGKHNRLTDEEKERIVHLYSILQSKKAVARAVKTTPLAVDKALGHVKKKPPVRDGYFDWRKYNNEIFI